MKPFLVRIRNWAPQYVLIVTLGYGLIVLLGACVVNIFQVTAAVAPFIAPPLVPREVGYGAALNWSLTYTVLFPVTACIMIGLLNKVPEALRSLAEQEMIRNKKTLGKAASDPLVHNWQYGTRGRRAIIIVFAIILPAALSLGEWLSNNLLRLLNSGPVANPPDYDWGLAGLIYHWGAGRCLANAFVDLLAFCYEGLMIGSFIAFFIYLMDLNRVLPQSVSQGALTLIPNLKSDDRRRGFEVFEELLMDMLWVVFLAYIMSYLVRIEGVYLAGNKAKSLFDFVKGDIVNGANDFVSGNHQVAKALGGLLEIGKASIQAVLAGFGSLVVLCFSLIVMVRTLRSAAVTARSQARFYHEKEAKALYGLPIDEEKKRLSTMNVWPFGYMRVHVLIMGVVLALTTLLFYRIGLYVTGLVVACVLVASINRFRKSFKES